MLFRFGARTTSEGPLSHPRSIDTWLRVAASSDGLTTLHSVINLLRADTEKEIDPEQTRLAALLHLDERIQPVLESLSQDFLYNRTAPRQVKSKSWHAQYDGEEHFIAAYERFMATAQAGGIDNQLATQMPVLVVRVLGHLFQQAKLRLYRHEQWIPAKWLSLHGWYRMASAAGISRDPVGVIGFGGVRTDTTVEREYLKALLMLKLNSGTLSARQIKLASDFLRLWSSLLEIQVQRPSTPALEIDPNSRHGLRHRVGNAAGSDLLYLDPSPLLQAIKHKLQTLVASAPQAGEGASERRRQIHLLRQLQHFWSASDIKKRSHRQPAMNESLPVVVGFSSMCRALQQPAETLAVHAPRQQDPYRYSIVGFAGLYMGGEVNGGKPVYNAVTPDAQIAEVWRILDQSESGFRCSGDIGNGIMLPIGSLVALMLSTDDWALALVRRVTKVSTTVAHYGIELIGRQARLITLRAPNESWLSVPRADIGPPIYGFRLASPSNSAAVHQSLVVPSSEFASGRARWLAENSRLSVVRFKAALAVGKDWTWTAFEEVRSPWRML